MALHSSEAIVLRTRPLGDADLVVTLLTRDEGKIEGVAKAARKSRRRFGGAFAPLTIGRASWRETEGRDLVRLETFDVATSFAHRQADLDWFYLFAYLAEVADTFAREREADERFYRLLAASAAASSAVDSTALVRRWFEIWTLRLQGLLPDFGACARCGRRSAGGGVVVVTTSGETLCDACAGEETSGDDRVHLTSDELNWVREALRRPVETLADPGRAPGIARLVQQLFHEFTGRPFRAARFLETDR